MTKKGKKSFLRRKAGINSWSADIFASESHGATIKAIHSVVMVKEDECCDSNVWFATKALYYAEGVADEVKRRSERAKELAFVQYMYVTPLSDIVTEN